MNPCLFLHLDIDNINVALLNKADARNGLSFIL